jgi:hypothetical protein
MGYIKPESSADIESGPFPVWVFFLDLSGEHPLVSFCLRTVYLNIQLIQRQTLASHFWENTLPGVSTVYS